jgi:hypothetical protein
MSALAVLAGYLLLALVTAVLAQHRLGERPTGSEWRIDIAVLAVCVGLAWPLFAAAWLVERIGRLVDRAGDRRYDRSHSERNPS